MEGGQDGSGLGAGCQRGWEVWWLLPGPVLTFDIHTFPLCEEAGRRESWPGRREGCSFSFMAKEMRDLLLHQGALSTGLMASGGGGRDTS